MLRSLQLKNFRSFQRFSMTELGRVNLLVGTNNCGKTSVLEAIQILTAQGQPEILWNSLAQRGERSSSENARMLVSDVRHLFYGHRLEPELALEISGKNDLSTFTFTAQVNENQDSQLPLDMTIDSQIPMNLKLHWLGQDSNVIEIPLVDKPRLEALRISSRLRQHPAIRFITTSALDKDRIVADFENIVLTDEEQIVSDALKTIEPTLERIAPVGSMERRNSYAERGGMMVKLSNSLERIPIGSMGDGIWRMLGIVLSLVNARGGVLLIDEIDTGLHYTAMEHMWRVVKETAARLDVQVFATTHSRDCYEALASVARPEASKNSEISIQRIEKTKEKAVFFTEQEMVIAAERAIEIR